MPNRLTKIYTRTGDQGSTGLADGSRLSKNAIRIECLGCLDELSSHIGLILTQPTSVMASDPIRLCLEEVQHILFDLGGDLSIPGRNSLAPNHIQWLESWLDKFNAELPPLKEFVLPGGTVAAAHCHVARTVCRRAERQLVSLAESEPLEPLALQYINRLSDFLFVVARILARQGAGAEVIWKRHRPVLLPTR